MRVSRGCLILVPTPIGNLGDITERAKTVLEEVDLIAAEDTRVTARLLAAYGLPKKDLFSYHKFNEEEKLEDLLAYLEEGKDCALLSDAGMPAISDPGQRLVRAAIERGFLVTALPGANAAITALAASGLNSRRFHFEGFLPNAGSDRKKRLEALTKLEDTCLIYEAPHRLLKLLIELEEHGCGERELCLAREISKKFETYLYGELASLRARLEEEAPRGEYVLVLEGREDYLLRHPEKVQEAEEGKEMQAREEIRLLLEQGMSPRDIRKQLASRSGLSRNRLYELILELAEEQ